MSEIIQAAVHSRDADRNIHLMGDATWTALSARSISPMRAGLDSRESPLSAFFSPVDGDGARVIWLLKQRRGGGIARLWGLLVDGEGLINVALSELSRRELRAERAEMERRAGVTMVEGDARLADFVLVDAESKSTSEIAKKILEKAA